MTMPDWSMRSWRMRVWVSPSRRHLARLVERCAAEDGWIELPAGRSQLETRIWQ
ncbi:hypothetical protein [Streptomyces guryensis]|uniref:Uncharacterized protein n=1 Tax=Streptomyces guryensis TaxID=2886947 RepID=A0A9Q3ZA50_9ACTN|nr:hypothetical protein [Streptomyces guryensis]MCD9877242.1 hypothetical protein [Streptomyces guryensis]